MIGTSWEESIWWWHAQHRNGLWNHEDAKFPYLYHHSQLLLFPICVAFDLKKLKVITSLQNYKAISKYIRELYDCANLT